MDEVKNNVIQGPWSSDTIEVESDSVDPSEFENVDAGAFSKVLPQNTGTMDTDISASAINEYEEFVSEDNLIDFINAKKAIRMINDVLIKSMTPIILGLNCGQIECLKYVDVAPIEGAIKQLDAIYAVIKGMLSDSMMNDFKRDYFYVCIYYMYERLIQEVEMEKNQ